MNKYNLKMSVFELNNYTMKTIRKGEEIYYVLEKSYFSKKDNKYITCGSMFVDRSMCCALVFQLGVRLFDNAKVFED